jgi:hypothetical protein
MGEIPGPYPSDEMTMHPVSSWINNPDVDNEWLTSPLETL